VGFGAGTITWLLSGLWVLAVAALLLGAPVPILYLYVRRVRRLSKLLSQLPEAFDSMSRTLRAGRTISQALQAVAYEYSPPVGDEFAFCHEQQNLGLRPEAAMRDLARRTGLLELKIFVLAVVVHRQTGGNLADLLEKLAAVIRDRYRIHGMIKSLTAEGRFQAIILLALPPFMLLAMLFVNRPYAITLFDYPLLLVTVFVSMMLGAFWMHRIIKFDF
jgi:tight adherence protein B